MTEDRPKEFRPGRGYSREDWDEVSNTPEWTDEEMHQARPFADVFPEMAASLKRSRGRPPTENPKQQVTLRLDAAIIERFKADGPGWQSRINDELRKAVGL